MKTENNIYVIINTNTYVEKKQPKVLERAPQI